MTEPTFTTTTRKAAYRRRWDYAATHRVTKGFHTPISTQTEPVPSIGACMQCGREYCYFGPEAACCTCGGRQFGMYDDRSSVWASRLSRIKQMEA